MQRAPLSLTRFKIRVSLHLNTARSFEGGCVDDDSCAFRFIVLASPFDRLQDLRRNILVTFAKLYPQVDASPDVFDVHLKDASGYVLDDDFAVGEVLEPNELVVLRHADFGRPGLMTPSSNAAVSPVAEDKAGPEIVCPAPKMRKLDPEDLLPPATVESTEEESDSSSETDGSSSSEAEQAFREPVALAAPAVQPSASMMTVDSAIASAMTSAAEDCSSSELEVHASSSSEEESDDESSSEGESSSSESEDEAAKPEGVLSSSEEEDSDDETSEDKAQMPTSFQPQVKAPVVLPNNLETSSASESEEDSSEEETSSSEEEEDSSESESSSSEESMDELTLPPAVTADVKQVLKGVPKYTSLTSLSDCLSQAVSGRATPLNPTTNIKPVQPGPTKGRVRLPRRKAASNSSGYDASLFA